MRIALGIEYDGAPYVGWQRQVSGVTVQQCVEEALSEVANEEIKVVCAGRTDTGVHAISQVVHFDTTAERSEYSWVFGGNTNLPRSISLLWQKDVSDEFHARFAALRRAYRFIIYNRNIRPAYLHGKVTWENQPLDVVLMQQAAACLIGKHDFTSYRAVACQSHSPVREVYKLTVTRDGEFVYIDIEANAFLQHMVRNIAGVLMMIGKGEREPHWSKQVLEHQDRTLGGITAPPHGLYFVGVKYPDEFSIPYMTNVKIL